MTRVGKIARLPREIRDELNRRLDDGHSGAALVTWLNAHPGVQSVLAANFEGRPISEQNLSEWKHGGFQDWLRLQDTRHLVRSLCEEASALSADSGDSAISALLSAPLAVALARCLRNVAISPADDPASQRALLAIARELSWLRRSDQSEKLLRIKLERWLTEQAKEKVEQEEEAASKEASAPMREHLHLVLLGLMQRMNKINMAALNPEPTPSPPSKESVSPEERAAIQSQIEAL